MSLHILSAIPGKFLICVLALTLLCVTNVQADNAAVGYELLYFYYVYKLQYQAGGKLTMATGCKTKDLKTGELLSGVCGFADFVRYVMDDRWTRIYFPYDSRAGDAGQPFTRDNTRTPGADVVPRIENAVEGFDQKPPVRYNYAKIESTVWKIPGNDDGSKSTAAFCSLVNRNFAVVGEAGVGSVDDMMSAVKHLKSAIALRYLAAQEDFEDALNHYLTPEARRYATARTGRYYDWDRILTSIDDAERSHALTSDEARDAKASIADYTRHIRAIPNADPTARSHLAVIQAFARMITEGQSWVDANEARRNHSGELSDRCSSSDEGESSDNPFGRRSITALGLSPLVETVISYGIPVQRPRVVSGHRRMIAPRAPPRFAVAQVS